MTRMPYGFDALAETLDDEPWSRLYTINEYLEDGQAIPPHLAQWLGLAIVYSQSDPTKLMRLLGLKRKPGRPHHRYSEKVAMDWGKRVFRYEEGGERPEAALSAVLAECSQQYPEGVSRTQLQKWRDDYRAAWNEAHCR